MASKNYLQRIPDHEKSHRVRPAIDNHDGSGKYADEVIPESYTDDNLRQKFEEDIETDAIILRNGIRNDLSSENSDHENQVELDQPLIIDDGSGKFCR